ncbi:MAG: serine hydrolase [Clostridia bacterium]|nr:serine hydrolase [Clostridia bacterium]
MKNKVKNIVLSVIAVILLALVGLIIYQNHYVDTLANSKEADAQKTISELKGTIDALQKELDKAVSENEQFKNTDELYRILNERYDRLEEYLNGKLSEKDAEIELLKEKLSMLERISKIDFVNQLNIISEIEALLNSAPVHNTSTYIVDESGKSIKKSVTVPGEISVMYYDLTLGFEFSYNEDVLMDPASMIKAPFALSLLIAASDEETNIAKERAEHNAADNNAPFEEPARVFDMNKTIIYTRAAYYREGSGEIVNSKDGTVYTYRDLFYHLLHCSDNVAYSVLMGEYGTEYLIDFAKSIGATSLLDTDATFTASDGIKILKAIYEFTESDAYYASFMKDAMMNSRHTLLISDSVSPAKSAHKYGWDTDSYCDMGIVYADSPYLVIIMTNYDEGNQTKINYLQNILKLIHEFHCNFYR